VSHVVTRPSVADERRFLSRELSVFLVQFSIALHKNTSYPRGHPLLQSAVEAVVLRLTSLLVERPTLSIGIARNQLIIDGVATDPENPVLRELAERLHRHQLGALKFSQGVGGDEVADLLATIGAASKRGDQPLGIRPKDELERWAHIRLFPLAFDNLELLDKEEAEEEVETGRANQLWLGLAAAALLDQRGGEFAPSLDAGDLAKVINEHRRDTTYAKVIVDYLMQLGSELRMGEGAEQQMLQSRLSALLTGLRPDVLKELLEVGGDLAKRTELVTEVAQAMPMGAVLELVQAAAAASQKTISHSLLRMLNKIAIHTEAGSQVTRHDADSALRETVRRLASNWTLEDPNPGAYTGMLDRLSSGSASAAVADEERPSEAPRLVKMSLETGVTGEAIWRAVDEMVDTGRLAELLEMLDNGVGVESTVEEYWRHLATPDSLRQILMDEQRGMEAVERIIQRMGLAAAEPMLDVLEITESRHIRRRLLTRLTQLGNDVGPLLQARLPGAPWFVQRNLLALMAALPTWPPEFTPRPYADNDDPRVRREALKLMFRVPEMREEAILEGIADDDDQIIRLALGAALERCPSSAASRLVTLINSRSRDAELRALAIRVLAQVPTVATRNWLLEHAVTKRQWFRGRKLHPKSPELLAILSVLASRWASHPAAAEVIKIASRSPDPDIRTAVTSPPPPTPPS
jgi:hypothetical protein